MNDALSSNPASKRSVTIASVMLATAQKHQDAMDHFGKAEIGLDSMKIIEGALLSKEMSRWRGKVKVAKNLVKNWKASMCYI